MVIVLSPSAADPLGYQGQRCAPALDSNYVLGHDDASSQAIQSTKSCRSFRSSLRKLLHRVRLWRKKGPEMKCDPDSTMSTSRQSMSLFEQSIALMRTSSIKSLGKSFRKHSHADMLDETWEDWLEQYQTGTINLSNLSRPVSFCGFGHMAAPHHKNEMVRLRSVRRVSDRRLWRKQKDWLDGRLRELLVQYRLKAATVSLIEKTCQVIQHEIGLGKRFPIISRELSLDAHTILSAEYFALLDAGSDWRTRLNPLVHGPPFIKFYVGVPIFINNQPIGCIAIFDPYLRGQVPKELTAQLMKLSQELSMHIESSFDPQTFPKRKDRIQWVDDDGDDDGSLSVITGTSDDSGDTCDSAPSISTLASICGLELSLSDTRMCPLLAPPTSRTILQPYEVFESLLRSRSIPQAIKKACRIVKQNLGTELVYIVEARVERTMLIPATSLRNLDSGAPLHGIPGVKEASEPMRTPRMHFVGYHGPALTYSAEAEVMASTEMHGTAITSKYGFRFSASEDSETALRSGLLIPFRRKTEYVSWDKLAVTPQSSMIPCNVHSGGFVMAAFVSHAREFSPGDVAFMKKVVKAVENILMCRDQQLMA